MPRSSWTATGWCSDAYVIPDVSVWAFEREPGETSPVIEGEAAYYVFRLDSLIPEGIPPLAAVRDQVLSLARVEKKKTLWEGRAAGNRGIPRPRIPTC